MEHERVMNTVVVVTCVTCNVQTTVENEEAAMDWWFNHEGED